MTSRVVNRDNGLRELAVRAQESIKLTVGIHEEQGDQPHPNGSTVAMVGAVLELGTDKRAPVGWLRSTIEERREALGQRLAQAGFGVVMRGETVQQAFGPVVKELADIARAKVPVDTGTVRDSIQGRVDGVVAE
jgi:hypothetical protein